MSPVFGCGIFKHVIKYVRRAAAICHHSRRLCRSGERLVLVLWIAKNVGDLDWSIYTQQLLILIVMRHNTRIGPRKDARRIDAKQR